MKKLLLTAALLTIATPAFAYKEHTIKEISNLESKNPYVFAPDTLTIQVGDRVTFENMQDDMHFVMFDSVPKALPQKMIMGTKQETKGSRWSHTFTVPGTYIYHCHPHKDLGMVGTLIVGTPSKEGETVAVEHNHGDESHEGESHDDHH